MSTIIDLDFIEEAHEYTISNFSNIGNYSLPNGDIFQIEKLSDPSMVIVNLHFHQTIFDIKYFQML